MITDLVIKLLNSHCLIILKDFGNLLTVRRNQIIIQVNSPMKIGKVVRDRIWLTLLRIIMQLSILIANTTYLCMNYCSIINIFLRSGSKYPIFIKKLSSLKTDSGTGPDGIPPVLLKSLSFILSRPLFHIFNCSFATSTFPNFWKVIFLTPIHKAGDRSLATNYRPISILSLILKVFESLFCDFLSPILDPVLNDHQFGFRSRRSTEGNILLHVDYLSNALENGHQVDTILISLRRSTGCHMTFC